MSYVLLFYHYDCLVGARDIVNLEKAQFSIDLGMQTSDKLNHHQFTIEGDS